jgi:hypothetical protein
LIINEAIVTRRGVMTKGKKEEGGREKVIGYRE